MQIRSEIIDGKKRIVITRTTSGVDNTKEAVLKIMGKGWEYKGQNNKGGKNHEQFNSNK